MPRDLPISHGEMAAAESLHRDLVRDLRTEIKRLTAERDQRVAEVGTLNVKMRDLSDALEDIADCEKRNGMVISGYEAVAIARRALNTLLTLERTRWTQIQGNT